MPNFDDVVRRQVADDHRVPARVRALVADLVVLRQLLGHAFDLSAVAFYQALVTLRHAADRGTHWLVRRDAQRVVQVARSRVWLVRLARAPQPPADPVDVGERRDIELALDAASVRTVPVLEPSPKWQALRAVLAEVAEDVQTAGADADVGRVLVVVKEARLVDELCAVLQDGENAFLQRQFEETFPSAAQRVRESEQRFGTDGAPRQVTLTQLAAPGPRSAPRRPAKARGGVTRGRGRGRPRERMAPGAGWRGEGSVEELREVFREVSSERCERVEVLVWCMEWVDVQGRCHRVLEEYRPAFVVLYNTDIVVVRAVEVYKAAHAGRPVRMYILAYDDAAEEDRFRGASSREKGAFKSLIRERATMSVHHDSEDTKQDMEFTQALLKGSSRDGVFSSRRGLGEDRDSRRVSQRDLAGAKPVEGGKVLVDTRELRSKLPMLLYQSKLTIVPLTLEVGDFILSKDIGIERKSVPDLYGSFASGRLFNQAEALCRHYKYPCLLIELDTAKPLSLTATSGGVPSEMSATSIVSKMVILIQQFPNLRLLWAKGPHDACELFASLKANEEEPDEETAASLGVDSKETGEEQFNAGPRALLRSLPGIDSQNMMHVMRKVRNVSSLIAMSKEEMIELLGNTGKGTQLYNFVNEEPSEALAAL